MDDLEQKKLEAIKHESFRFMNDNNIHVHVDLVQDYCEKILSAFSRTKIEHAGFDLIDHIFEEKKKEIKKYLRDIERINFGDELFR